VARANQIAGFDRQVLGEAKALIDHATLPANTDLVPRLPAFFRSVARLALLTFPGAGTKRPPHDRRKHDRGTHCQPAGPELVGQRNPYKYGYRRPPQNHHHCFGLSREGGRWQRRASIAGATREQITPAKTHMAIRSRLWASARAR
jgi:hypothetical protein